MFRSISVVLSANSTTFVSQMRSAGVAMDDFHRKAESGAAKAEAAATRSHKALTALAVVAATALVAGMVSSVRAAGQFEVALRNVATISDSVRENFAQTSRQIIEMSTRLPQSAKTLAEGLYEIASSGFQGAEGMEVLDKSARAASAGLTTTNNAAKGITAVLNAYGKSAFEAGDISDILFQTVNLGVVTFEELSGQLGDFVGTAAQLRVPIDEAAAAFAAMTLSGISASEASTSLNRVMLSFIKPSEAMTELLKANNQASGAAAVQNLGLKGAIDLVTKATGGSIEAMAELFPEVRGLRGALALAAAEGANYARTTAGIADANVRAGATQRALDEQMKAAGAQWNIFKNQIDAGRIALGTALLPVLVDVMRGIQDLAHDALPALISAGDAMAPFFKQLGGIGSDLIDILTNLVDALGPTIAALAGIAGTGIIVTLTGLATALRVVTDFLAEHEGAVTAVAVAYGAFFLVARASAALAALPVLLDTIAFGLYGAAGAADAAAASLLTLRGAALALGAVAGVLAFTAAIGGMQKAKQSADALYDTIVKPFDLSSYKGLSEALDEIGMKQMDLEANTKTRGGLFNAFRGAAELLTPMENSVQDAREAITKLNEEAARLSEVRANVFANLNAVAVATGRPRDEIEKLAKTLGVDLTKGFADSEGERGKLIHHIKELATNAYGAGRGLVAMADESYDAIKAASDAVNALAKSAGDAFASSFDVLTNFAAATKDHTQALNDEASAADKVASAQDRVADAQQRAVDAEEKVIEAHQRVADAQEKIIEAEDRVAQSEQDLADLRVDVAERSAEAHERYAEHVQESNDNILRAEQDLADKRISLAQDVADAQRRLEEDRLQGQERVAAAEQRIRDVEKRAADDARERQQRESDRRRLDNAKTPEERQRIQAEIDRRKAQEDDRKAREQAAKDLKDAQSDLQKIREENADKEKKNQEALAKAQEDQAKGIEEAERNVTKARKEALDVQKEGRELAKQAVEDEKQIAAAVKSVEDARRGVIDAQKNAAEAVGGIADAERDAAKAGAEVGRAQSDAARAYGELAEAQKRVADTSLEGFFQKTIDDAKRFADGIREAARQGLNPDYIAQLLREGPEKAAPILDAIMQDQTGTLVRQMNAARDGLKTVQEQMVEAARVTQRAINATNTDMAAEYGTAMEILAAKAALGGQATAQAIADKLKIGVGEVERIAHDYVIVLTKGINPLLEAIGAGNITSEGRGAGGGVPAGVYVGNMALGGTVPGQGDQDTVPAMLTPGEYVISKPAVQRIGVENLEAMHKKARRGYATGGFVYPNDVPVPPGEMDDFGWALGYSGAMADQKMYYAVRDFLAKHPPTKKGGGSGGTGSNYGFQALIDYLTNRGVDFEVTSTTGGGHAEGSRHFMGLAADFAGDMSAIGDAFMDVRQSMYELIHNPGYSVKGGQNVDPGFWGSDTWAGHANHVHAATFKDASEGPGLPSGKPGGGEASGSLYDWIDQAMALTGVDGSWRDPLYRRAMYESSGDPHAQNDWDSNAEAGTPSRGLMQTIPSTFEAYKVPGHDDIWNPVDNMAAAIRYIQARYGSIHEIDPPTSGYGKGGLVDLLKKLPAFHGGGMVPGDQEVIARLEGGEGVLSRQAMMMGSPVAQQINSAISTALRGYGGAGVISSAPPIDTKALAAAIGQEVVAAIASSGIKVEANGKQIGDLVAERFAKMSKR